MNEHVKILFNIEHNEDGYPPDSCERLWAKPLVNGNYEIDNIPFFVYDISAGDEVSAQMIDGELTFGVRVVKSTNSTFRLIAKQNDNSSKIRDIIQGFDCRSEFNARVNLIAVEVPGSVSIKPFIDYIVAARARGELDYEEGALRHSLS